jgi:hypothetical protein
VKSKNFAFTSSLHTAKEFQFAYTHKHTHTNTHTTPQPPPSAMSLHAPRSLHKPQSPSPSQQPSPLSTLLSPLSALSKNPVTLSTLYLTLYIILSSTLRISYRFIDKLHRKLAFEVALFMFGVGNPLALFFFWPGWLLVLGMGWLLLR